MMRVSAEVPDQEVDHVHHRAADPEGTSSEGDHQAPLPCFAYEDTQHGQEQMLAFEQIRV